jgi:ADP-dependent NAD(P)H-hydrate dehydratase / NAD(P)H-hydrate epimerase
MKFFSTAQIREIDRYTIEHEPISSIDLMERAAVAIVNKYTELFGTDHPVCILAGPGNNGGDALAVARILLQKGYDVTALLLSAGSTLSADCNASFRRLEIQFPRSVSELSKKFIDPELSNDTIIIDGIFGSGLSRQAEVIFAEAINWINSTGRKVVSIDIPSGLRGEENEPLDSKGDQEKNPLIVNAEYTFSLQFPKLAFLFPENSVYIGRFLVLGIGLHPQAIASTPSDFYFQQQKDIAQIVKPRPEYSHKGTFGHALILAGSKGMAGASILSGKAALCSGAGLVSVHGPASSRTIVQTAVPELIFHSDKSEDHITGVNQPDAYDAVAIGPGIGKSSATASFLKETLGKLHSPCVLDADALNLIAQNKEIFNSIPHYSILTPHPKEFEHLFGATGNSYEQMLKAQEMSKKHCIIIVLKGRYTLIAMPDGKLFFNSTGNSGMATAGSGDVLTGVLAGLLAQGYTHENTAKLGVFLHGRAGDLALKKESKESLIASDIIANLGKAFNSLKD